MPRQKVGGLGTIKEKCHLWERCESRQSFHGVPPGRLSSAYNLPTVLRSDGYDVAGAKLRLKNVPLQAVNGEGGFAGVNLELTRLKFRYSESRTTLESRFIVGWRSAQWLFAANPIVGAGLSPGYAGQRPDFSLGTQISRRIAPDYALGLKRTASSGPSGGRWLGRSRIIGSSWPLMLTAGRGSSMSGLATV